LKAKIEKIISNWLTFMDLEKLHKLRIDKKGKSGVLNEQFLNYDQVKEENSFLSFSITQKQYDTFIDISKYFKFLTLSLEEKEKFIKNDEIDDNIYMSAILIGVEENDKTNNKKSRYIYPLLSIPLKHFQLIGKDLKIESINKLQTYNIFKNFLMDTLLIDESDIVDGENLIEFFSKLTNTNLRQHNFLEIIDFVTEWVEKRLSAIDSDMKVHKTANKPDFLISKLDVEDYTLSIYNDLKHKKDNGLDFLSKNELVSDYLFGKPTNTYNQELLQVYHGAFGSHQLAKGQAITMQKVENEDRLIAVQGAPGTGKTTLLLSIMANRIVKRALAIIDNKDFDNLILITSTSNKAVDNISDEFAKKFNDYNWLYFIWGNDTKRNNSFNRLQQTIALLKDDNNQHDETKLKGLKAQILQLNKEIDNALGEYKMLLVNIEKTQAEITKIKKDILIYESDKSKYETQKSQALSLIKSKFLELPIDTNSNLKSMLTDIDIVQNLKQIKIQESLSLTVRKYQQDYDILSKLSTEYNISEITNNQMLFDKLHSDIDNLHSDINNSSFINIIKNLFGRRTRLIETFTALNEHFVKKAFYNIEIKNLNDMLKIKSKIDYYKSNIHNTSFTIEECNKFLNAFKIYKTFIDFYNGKVKEIETFDTHISEIIRNIDSSASRLSNIDLQLSKYQETYNSKYSEGFLEYFKNNFQETNNTLFEISLRYIWETILLNKKDIIKSLEEWEYSMKTFSSDDRKSEFYNNLEKHKKNISLVYPLMTSTLSSSLGLFYSPKPNIYDYLIVDEAGMIPPHLLFPLITRSKRAIVVGDPKQLEPIISISDTQKEEYKEKLWAYIESDETNRYIEYQKYSPTMSTAYHRAAKCQTVEFDDIGDGIILDEHRRCLPDIAEIFIDIANYDKLKIKTQPIDAKHQFYESYNSFGGKSLYFSNIEIDAMQDNVNYKEIEHISKLLNMLKECGFDLESDIGIITPYRNQASKLISKYKKTINHTRKLEKIGTVHKFQGAEFPVVIFSSVIGKNDSINFINSKPNMLNVAVSRAKTIFIVVGNIELLKKGTYSGKMIKHIIEKGQRI
jgi:hypothetical protein